MKKNSRHSSSKAVMLWAAAATLYSPFFANAVGLQCNLSGNASSDFAGCSGTSAGGYRTSDSAVKETGFVGAKLDTTDAVAPVHAWSVCRWVDKTTSRDVFIPFRTSQEWTEFRNHLPAEVTTNTCALAYSALGAPYANTTINPPFAGCTSITYPTPDVYGRTGISLYPPSYVALGQNLTCHAGATAMMSAAQLKAGNVEDGGTSSPTGWDSNFAYSPDMTLSVNPPAVDFGQPLTITWNIEPTGSISCSKSDTAPHPTPWGPDASGNPRSGSTTISPFYDGATFNLSCTKVVSGLALTSSTSASASVYNVPPGWDPGCDCVPPPPPGDGGGPWWG